MCAACSHSANRSKCYSSIVMLVRVLYFGVLKDKLATAASDVELPPGSSVLDLLEQLSASGSMPEFESIAVSVNTEFASAQQVLREGDEVGLLPPVSGGAPRTIGSGGNSVTTLSGTVALTRDPIESAALLANAKQGEDGALVVFEGIVRNQTRRRKVVCLDYEAYEEMALRQLDRLAGEAKERFGVRHVTMVHRLGRLQVSECSILIIVAAGHRAQAFEACRWLIDTVKKTVPIWKKETFVDGAVWADGEPFPDDVSIAPRQPQK